MRILVDGRYINDRFPGIGRATFNLLQAMSDEIGQDELLVLVNPKLASSRHDVGSLARRGRCRIVNCDVPRFLPLELARLPGIISRLAPDVFHAPFYLRPYGLPCPCVVSLYDLIPLQPGLRAVPFVDRIVFKFGARLACRSSAVVLVPSEHTAHEIRRWEPGAAEKIVVAPLAVDPLLRLPGTLQAERVRQRLGIERPYVLHFGSAAPHKNTAGLLAAWAILSGDAGKHHDLVIAGPNAERQNPALSSVRYIGRVNEADLPTLYAGADLFVSPSFVEGFGLTVLEAMSCGTAVLCSNGGALAEVARDAACTIDVTDPGIIAGAIRRLLDEPQRREELIVRGRKRAAEFSWPRTSRVVLDAFRRAIAS